MVRHILSNISVRISKQLTSCTTSRSYHAPMQEDPKLFDVAAAVPLGFAKQALAKYASQLGVTLPELKIQGRAVDVGCGQGAVTKYIAQHLASEARMDAFDLSEDMISYAKENYADEKINFFALDAASPVPDSMRGVYDFITCNNVLHWSNERRRILANMSAMLKPGKDCCFVLFHYNPVYTAWQELAKMPKWAPYSQDVDSLIGPYQYIKNADEQFRNVMIECGFKNVRVTSEEMDLNYHKYKYDMEVYKPLLRGVNPFILRIPTAEDQKLYIDDMIKVLTDIGGFKDFDSSSPYDGRALYLDCKLIIALGSV